MAPRTNSHYLAFGATLRKSLSSILKCYCTVISSSCNSRCHEEYFELMDGFEPWSTSTWAFDLLFNDPKQCNMEINVAFASPTTKRELVEIQEILSLLTHHHVSTQYIVMASTFFMNSVNSMYETGLPSLRPKHSNAEYTCGINAASR